MLSPFFCFVFLYVCVLVFAPELGVAKAIHQDQEDKEKSGLELMHKSLCSFSGHKYTWLPSSPSQALATLKAPSDKN